MYTNTGYLHQVDMDLEDLSLPLTVESCGVYRLVHRPVMTTSRPQGRMDYQLLFIASGHATFTFGGESHQLPPGTVVLYRPGEPQQYVYRLEDQAEVYWVHFTGYRAASLTEKAGFCGVSYLNPGVGPEFSQMFLRMIRELQVQRPCFGEILALTLEQLFWMIRRHLDETAVGNRRIQKEVEHAVHFFNENFSSPINIGDYAKSQHMSTCWFIRSFKQYIGMPPMQYLTSIRIAKAKGLLESTDYNVTEIASIVGYDNPLYFSRIFKKLTGQSPLGYRKNRC